MWRKTAMASLLLVALWILIFLAQPVQAQTGLEWSAQFYNNIYLLGEPALNRHDSTIAFDWGVGAPATNVNADYFSVRWGADPYFAAGTYRFYVLADDSVCIRVDFQQLCETFSLPRPGETISADVALAEGVHHVQVDYKEVWGDAYVYVTWANLAANPTTPIFSRSIQPQSGSVIYSSFWTAQYFNNASLFGSPALTVFESWPLTRNWQTGSPASGITADKFSARWTTVQTLSAGNYQISVRADDGIRVFVDGVMMINEFHGATGITYNVDIWLYAGQHHIVVEYYEADGQAYIEFGLTVVNSQMATSSATLKVIPDVLNVRQSPNCNCNILAEIYQGDVYPIIGRNADSSWWQINAYGRQGWVFAPLVDVTNTLYVPVTDFSYSQQPPLTGYDLTATAIAIIRSSPGNRFAYLGYLRVGQGASIVGRNAGNSWWQIDANGVVGWIDANLAQVPDAMDLNLIPIR